MGWLSVVGGQWSTCSWVGCRSSVVGGSVEDQSMGRWLVVGGRWPVGRRWFCNTPDFNCTMDKMDRDSENKILRLYRCCSNYALSKLIVDNGLEDLWRRENPDSHEFTCYDRTFSKDP